MWHKTHAGIFAANQPERNLTQFATVAQNSRPVCLRADSMPAEERFRFLRDQVIPPHSNGTIRILIDFAPTYASPMTTKRLRGRSLVSPAIDLIAAATETGRLDELRGALARCHEKDDRNRVAKLSLLILLAIARQDLTSTTEAIDRLSAQADDMQQLLPSRAAFSVLTWEGKRQPKLRSLARTLTVAMYVESRKNRPMRGQAARIAGTWDRQIHALQNWYAAEATRQQDSPAETQLEHWVAAARVTAATNSQGFPRTSWKSSVGLTQHLTGHDEDLLYFMLPLKGNFSVEAVLHTGGAGARSTVLFKRLTIRAER